MLPGAWRRVREIMFLSGRMEMPNVVQWGMKDSEASPPLGEGWGFRGEKHGLKHNVLTSDRHLRH